MIRYLENVRSGIVDPKVLKTCEKSRRAYTVQLSRNRDIENVHTAGVNSLDIDRAEGRFLLSGAADGSLHIHDLYNFSGSPSFTAKLVCKVEKDQFNAHRYSIECVQWYPFDNGLFVTSGMDKHLKIWDTNRMKPADVYCFEGRVFQHHLSEVASKHCYVAVATSINQVVLVDLKSGSYIHELRGHTSATLTCRWSPRDEYLLATGSCDNRILLWDVRSSKSCLKSLDQYNGKGRSHNNLTSTAHDGIVNGLCFSPDGLYLLSVGTDNRMRLWNVFTGEKEMANFGNIPNESRKSVQLDVASDSNPLLVYVPSEGTITLFEVHTGEKINTLSGHFNSVNSCRYHPHYQELYSGGNDRNVLVWSSDHSDEIDSVDNDSKVPSDCNNLRRIPVVWKSKQLDSWSSDEEG